jgi:thymidylate synthase
MKNDFDEIYKSIVKSCLKQGDPRFDRTGTGRLSIFGKSFEIDLQNQFPLLSLKHTPLRLVFEELMWMLRGETNVLKLKEKNVSIWDEWADETGDLGPVYGAQWRGSAETQLDVFRAPDQIKELIWALKNNPASSRMMVNAWNVYQLDDMALPPCHFAFQCFVKGGDQLSLMVHQRSADVFLGLPFNIASYALLTHLLAQSVGMHADRLIWTGGDIHIYKNHTDQCEQLLQREPFRPCSILINRKCEDVWSWSFEDVTLSNYAYHPSIKADVAV